MLYFYFISMNPIVDRIFFSFHMYKDEFIELHNSLVSIKIKLNYKWPYLPFFAHIIAFDAIHFNNKWLENHFSKLETVPLMHEIQLPLNIWFQQDLKIIWVYFLCWLVEFSNTTNFDLALAAPSALNLLYPFKDRYPSPTTLNFVCFLKNWSSLYG